jgi:hypothetical protein
MPATVQHIAIAVLRQRFTLGQTRRTVPIMFSIPLVHATGRQSLCGSPSPPSLTKLIEPQVDEVKATNGIAIRTVTAECLREGLRCAQAARRRCKADQVPCAPPFPVRCQARSFEVPDRTHLASRVAANTAASSIRRQAIVPDIRLGAIVYRRDDGSPTRMADAFCPANALHFGRIGGNNPLVRAVVDLAPARAGRGTIYGNRGVFFPRTTTKDWLN